MIKTYDVIVPVRLDIPTKHQKYFQLNLNVYRNIHYFKLNQAKKTFESIVWHLLDDIPPMKTVELTYTFFPGSYHKSDLSNVCCVVDKFFCDALVHKGIIKDDNYTVVTKITYCFGEVDLKNDHVKITIKGELK